MEEGLEPSVLQLSEGTRDFLAGGIGGAFGVIAGQPLDTIRIRQQQPGAGGAGARQFARAILAAEGGRSFFRGMGYPLCTAALQTAVVFQAYGIAARHLAGGQPTTALSLPQVFYAGCFAGAIQTVRCCCHPTPPLHSSSNRAVLWSLTCARASQK